MGTITIVGLGPGAVGHLSLETMGLLQNCAQVILRTAVHPTVAELEKQNVKFTHVTIYTKRLLPLKRFITVLLSVCWQQRRTVMLFMLYREARWLRKKPLF